MSQNFTTPFLGSIGIAKIDGVTSGIGSTFSTQTTPITAPWIIPTARAMPRNPFNKVRPGIINRAPFPSVEILGKRTPRISISAVAKPNWFTADFLNSLVLSFDSRASTPSPNASDLFSICLYDASAITYNSEAANPGQRIYDACRCESISIYQTAVGGPITVDMSFKAIYGENESKYPANGQAAPSTLINNSLFTIAPTAFTTSDLVTSAGQLFDISHVTYGSGPTMNQVRSWRINMNRGQDWVMYSDQTYYAADIVSGMFAGSLTVEHSPTASIVPTGSTGAATIKVAGGGVTVDFAMLLSEDQADQDQDLGLGHVAHAYALADMTAGGAPMVITNS